MSKFAAEKQAVEKAISGMTSLIQDTTDYMSIIDQGVVAVMTGEELDSGIQTILIDTMSEIMVHRNAVIAGRAKLTKRLEFLQSQLPKIPN